MQFLRWADSRLRSLDTTRSFLAKAVLLCLVYFVAMVLLLIYPLLVGLCF